MAAIATTASTRYMTTAAATGICPALAQAAGAKTTKIPRSTQRQPLHPEDDRTSVLLMTFPWLSRVIQICRPMVTLNDRGVGAGASAAIYPSSGSDM
jgi:hypothetical protein